MNNSIKLAIVVVVGILLGLLVLQNNIKTPAIQEILKQQDTIIKSQMNLEKEFSGGGKADSSDSSVAALKERVSKLEAKLDLIEKLMTGGGQQQGRQPQQPPQEDFSKVYTIDIGKSPIRGEQNASITIVGFSDFQCPFCGRFHPAIEEVLKAYPKDVRYILKHFPLSFHQQAKPAAKAAMAAGEQGKYWEMVDALYANSQQLGEEKFKEIAKSLGIDVDKFVKDLKEKDAQWEEAIKEDMALGSKSEVRGTPTFFINGRKTAARDINGFKAEIDKLIKK
ncbi:MAG: thioredoxin domain-containing protein [Candidatus Omnitrophica bacterium]|nr:thioredoxin domain-containing protein [Candidatus Omnitrophota bacterium]